MNDYLNCPFCGSTNLINNTWHINDGEFDAIECKQCAAGALKSVWNDRSDRKIEQLLTTDKVAYILGLKPKSVANMRFNGEGPEYVTLNARCVRYKPSAIEAYINEKPVRIKRSRLPADYSQPVNPDCPKHTTGGGPCYCRVNVGTPGHIDNR